MKKFLLSLVFLFCAAFPACKGQTQQAKMAEAASALPFDTDAKTIHLFVALCDNKYQGIVPVPAKIGNGQDPGNNL